MVLLAKVPKDDFDLRSSLNTYIFAISSNIWLMSFRDSKIIVRTELTMYEKYLADYEEAEEHEKEADQSRIRKALSMLKKVSAKSKVLLTAIFYDGKNIETVTKEFQYTNKHNAKNQQYKC